MDNLCLGWIEFNFKCQILICNCNLNLIIEEGQVNDLTQANVRKEFVWLLPILCQANWTPKCPQGLKFLVDLILQPFLFQFLGYLIGGLSLNNWTLITFLVTGSRSGQTCLSALYLLNKWLGEIVYGKSSKFRFYLQNMAFKSLHRTENLNLL